MEGVLLIAVIGLALALGAALFALRRRADELDALHGSVTAPPEPPPASIRDDRAADPVPAEVVTNALEALLPVGVVHVDAANRIDRANPAAHRLLALGPGRLRGRTLMEAFLDTRIETLVLDLPEGGSATGELHVGDPDRRELVVRVHRPPGAGTWIVLEDVSELRRLEQIRSAFIDNVGHELRTPLTTVSLLAETLARDAQASDVPARMRDRIAKIEIETGHLVQMVNELLDLARIEGGSMLRLADDVDVVALAQSSVERLRLFAERQRVTLVVEAEPDLPVVRGDEARLGQVIVNLVHNAVKFSPDGGEVRITVRRAGDEIVTSVVDHGIGIAAADQPRIFERFYKADRARVRGGGTGLGLSIARHVVEGHGGHIWVESVQARGSTFSFALPLAGPTPETGPAMDDTAVAPAGVSGPA